MQNENDKLELQEVLTPQQRMRRKMVMRRLKSRIALGRKRAARRKASPEVIKKRAQRAARNVLLKRILKTRKKSDLSYSARAQAEKQLARRKGAIKGLARRLLPKVRKAEMERLKRRSQAQSQTQKESHTKSFSQYITEETKEITVAWGRVNPPTIGHGKLFDATAAVAGKNAYRIYLSHTTDPKKNPLTYQQKIKYAREMFPKRARSIILDEKIKTLFDLMTKLYDEGFTRVNFVAGSDRVPEYEALLSKYNAVKGRHGFYNFEGGINVISAGERDPDAEGVSGMSASKMRAAAQNNDMNTFMKGLPPNFKKAKQLFNDIRKGMGLKESYDFRTHLKLSPVSNTRESYVEGNLFEIDDLVIVKENDELAKIIMLGSNYILVEMSDGKKCRKWLEDVEKLETSAWKTEFKEEQK